MAKSGCNSIPAKTPFFPRTVPTNRTIPCMFPGTSTESPTAKSSPIPGPGPGLRPGVVGIIFAFSGDDDSVRTLSMPYVSLTSGMAARDDWVSAARDPFRGRELVRGGGARRPWLL